MWGLNNVGQSGGTPDADIDAPEAWNHTTGSSDVIVAVIDSGVDYNHPDLSATMTLQAGSGNRTVTFLDLRRSANTGVWDTIPKNGYWVSGAASSLDAPLLNASNGTANFTVVDGGSFNIIASDTANNLFVAGSSFTLTVRFSDGATAMANAIAP